MPSLIEQNVAEIVEFKSKKGKRSKVWDHFGFPKLRDWTNELETFSMSLYPMATHAPSHSLT